MSVVTNVSFQVPGDILKVPGGILRGCNEEISLSVNIDERSGHIDSKAKELLTKFVQKVYLFWLNKGLVTKNGNKHFDIIVNNEGDLITGHITFNGSKAIRSKRNMFLSDSYAPAKYNELNESYKTILKGIALDIYKSNVVTGSLDGAFYFMIKAK